MASSGFIRIEGARQNNLYNLTFDLPLGMFHVLTGPSGSGKSSLAFDTLYAEGQRRTARIWSNRAKASSSSSIAANAEARLLMMSVRSGASASD